MRTEQPPIMHINYYGVLRNLPERRGFRKYLGIPKKIDKDLIDFLIGVYAQDVEPGKILREDSDSYVKREVMELVMDRSGIKKCLGPNPILSVQDEGSKIDFLMFEAQRRPVAVLDDEQDQLASTLIKYALNNRHSLFPIHPIVIGAVPDSLASKTRSQSEGQIIRHRDSTLVTIGDIGLVEMLDIPELTYEGGVRFGRCIQNVCA